MHSTVYACVRVMVPTVLPSYSSCIHSYITSFTYYVKFDEYNECWFCAEHDIIAAPFETKSDSFYFVEGKLIMHNKAEYAYNAGL